MMDVKRFLNTIVHLKCAQVFYQSAYRLFKPRIKYLEVGKVDMPKMVRAIEKPCCRNREDIFCFLNIESHFQSWNDNSNGNLWVYNLNYMDYLLQPGMSKNEGQRLIEKFIDELPDNKVGLDPYPIALRGINWIKWMAQYGSGLSEDEKKKINDSLYSQYRLLERKLEYHLLGNHLLEDAYSLTIGAIYFSDSRIWRRAVRLLEQQLMEQILPDGTHYEQSPMYHCILLDRLLDVINISTSNPRFGDSQIELNSFLRDMAVRMLGHLENIEWTDGSIPLLNDSAYCIAPAPAQLKDYATRLGLSWVPIPMNECGYRKIKGDRMEAIVDIGNITASYQPGHSHADTFNYELRIDGKPFIVDTGISTYNKTPRRQYERSTSAHNTVVIDGKDSSEVWGGFRMGRRARVTLISDHSDEIVASHDGYPASFHRRRFALDQGIFSVTDYVKGYGTSLIHLAPDIRVCSVNNSGVITDIATIEIENGTIVKIEDEKVSTEYNRFRDTKVIKIEFSDRTTYKIMPSLIKI